MVTGFKQILFMSTWPNLPKFDKKLFIALSFTEVVQDITSNSMQNFGCHDDQMKTNEKKRIFKMDWSSTFHLWHSEVDLCIFFQIVAKRLKRVLLERSLTFVCLTTGLFNNSGPQERGLGPSFLLFTFSIHFDNWNRLWVFQQIWSFN